MPTSRRLPPLLALLLAGSCDPACAASNADVPTPAAITRLRAGTISAGPASAPRRKDGMVEPVLFQSIGVEKPIEEPEPFIAADPQKEPPAVDVSAVEPMGFEAAQETLPAQPLAPPKARPEYPPSGSAGRALGSKKTLSQPESKAPRAENPLTGLLEWRPSSRTLTATVGGLAIAVGLVLSFTWLLRSLAPKSTRPLPRDVVEVLGRAPLGGKQTTQLVRVGSKLVLIAITPEGAETLTEITDPDEVARLVAACDAKRGDGSAAEFDQLLQQMSGERSAPGFLDRAASEEVEASFDPRSLAAAYANTPGGRGDG